MERKYRHLHLVPRIPEQSQDRDSSRCDPKLRKRVLRRAVALAVVSTLVVFGSRNDSVREFPGKIVASFNAEDDAPRIQVGDFCYVDGTVDGIPDDTTGECPD
jgi:hypothetical protein